MIRHRLRPVPRCMMETHGWLASPMHLDVENDQESGCTPGTSGWKLFPDGDEDIFAHWRRHAHMILLGSSVHTFQP